MIVGYSLYLNRSILKVEQVNRSDPAEYRLLFFCKLSTGSHPMMIIRFGRLPIGSAAQKRGDRRITIAFPYAERLRVLPEASGKRHACTDGHDGQEHQPSDGEECVEH